MNTPRADKIVDDYLDRCDRVHPDGTSAEDIERDLRKPIRQLEHELAEANARAEAALDKAMQDILSAPDERIQALLRQEGRDPKDAATIVQQAAEIAILRAELAEARKERDLLMNVSASALMRVTAPEAESARQLEREKDRIKELERELAEWDNLIPGRQRT